VQFVSVVVRSAGRLEFLAVVGNPVRVPEDSLSLEQVLGLLVQRDAQNAELTAVVVSLTARVAELTDEVVALRRQLGSDSSNSSRPLSSDSPFDKPARKRSSRSKSGRKPGKQAGAPGVSRGLSDDPNRIVVDLEPLACRGCGTGASVVGAERRQVVDAPEPVAPQVVEYRRITECCSGCGVRTAAVWEHPGVDTGHVAGGSPVRIGPAALARAALLTCGHYLPVLRREARDFRTEVKDLRFLAVTAAGGSRILVECGVAGVRSAWPASVCRAGGSVASGPDKAGRPNLTRSAPLGVEHARRNCAVDVPYDCADSLNSNVGSARMSRPVSVL
jgi:hypothetical protein